MTSHLSRLVLGVLAAVTLVLTAGGAVGLWPTGAPASRLESQGELPRPAAARVLTRDMEGTHGDVRPADPVRSVPPTDTRRHVVAALPARSGSGRRVVFDTSAQRVWLVGADDAVRQTYPVSGSATDNLHPGSYEVYSRSRHAVSYTYEETMGFMVRFAHGENAAIGFHDIPVDQRGRRVQTRAQLGEPLSSGCIRQARPDAVALWKFADLGTSVVVVG